MKRWTFRIVVCLLLGVVTTVGVAWGCAIIRTDAPYVDAYSHDTSAPYWHVQIQETFGHSARSRIPSTPGSLRAQRDWPIVEHPSWSVASTRPTLAQVEDTNATLDWPIELASGLPMRSLFVEVRALGSGKNKQELYTMTPGIAVSYYDVGVPEKVLALTPIPVGFLVDTLFYAAIWFALTFGLRAHLRVIRQWQGHCPMCKYDLRGDLEIGCPECGWGRAENARASDCDCHSRLKESALSRRNQDRKHHSRLLAQRSR